MIGTVYDGQSGLCVQFDTEEGAYSVSTGDEQERLVISPEMLEELQNVDLTKDTL